MASSSQYGSTGVGASSTNMFEVEKIIPTTRTKEIFDHMDLCLLTTGETKARCKGCGAFFRPDSNSSLRNHLLKHCPARKNNPDDDQSQMSQECGVWNFDPDMVREMMGNLVIQEGLPFNHFDNPRLTRMIQKTLQPRYKQVSRATLRRDCLKRWQQAKKELILGFENLKTGVSLTTDVWSAPHGSPHSYICVTAHWVDPVSWQMMKRVIAFEMFPYPHTGENLFHMLDGIIQTFNLQEKLFSITFDNASNNTNAVRKLILKYKPVCNGAFFHTRCVAHIINLIVQDGLSVPQMQQLTEKFRNMLRAVFSSSRKRYTDYQKLCRDTNSITLGPYWDVPTRWNSTCRMFENGLRQRDTLQAFHDHLSERRKCRRFGPNSWMGVEIITGLLKVFKEATTILSGVYYPTSPLVLHQLFEMTNAINEIGISGEVFNDMVLPMKQKLLKYFQEMPAVFCCATTLNPIYNGAGVETLIDGIINVLDLNEPNFASSVKSNFNTCLQNLFDFYLNKYGEPPSNIHESFASSSSSTSANKKLKIFNLLKDNFNKRVRGDSQNSELGRYLGSNWINNLTPDNLENLDILAWWKEREPQFPILAAMARDLLSVQASTVASKSTFSVSGRVLSIRRTRLTPASMEMAICLKDHLDAADRIQDKSSLEGELEVEERIFDAKISEGMTSPLTEEEEAMDEWMRTHSPEGQSEGQSSANQSEDQDFEIL